MENNKENALNDFLEMEKKEKIDNKKVVIDEREGLIERIDRTIVTSDGRQLLREQY